MTDPLRKQPKMVKTTITVAQQDLDLVRACADAFEGIKISQVIRAALRVGIPALARNPGLLWTPVQAAEAARPPAPNLLAPRVGLDGLDLSGVVVNPLAPPVVDAAVKRPARPNHLAGLPPTPEPEPETPSARPRRARKS